MKHVEHVGRPAFVVLAAVVLASMAVGARALGPVSTSSGDRGGASEQPAPRPSAAASSSDPRVVTTPATVPPNAQMAVALAQRPSDPPVAAPTTIAQPTARLTVTTAPDDDGDGALQRGERTDDGSGRREQEADEREG